MAASKVARVTEWQIAMLRSDDPHKEEMSERRTAPPIT